MISIDIHNEKDTASNFIFFNFFYGCENFTFHASIMLLIIHTIQQFHLSLLIIVWLGGRVCSRQRLLYVRTIEVGGCDFIQYRVVFKVVGGMFVSFDLLSFVVMICFRNHFRVKHSNTTSLSQKSIPHPPTYQISLLRELKNHFRSKKWQTFLFGSDVIFCSGLGPTT